jgi:cytochrome P450
MKTVPRADVPSLPFDLSDRSHFREGMPFELFAQIREGEPIWWHPPTEGTRRILETGFYVASRHVDLVAMARDPERFSSRDGVGLRVTDGVPSISSLDPPLHTRWRRLIGRSFTRNKVRRLEDMMEARAERILDDVVGRGECDFVSDVSHLLPLHVIADIVGIPEADRAAVFEDVNRMTRYEDPCAGLPAEAFEQAKQSLATYAWHLTRERRASPRDDIWSELIAAEVELEDGSTTRFDDDELGIWFMTLALAGSETTRNVLAIGLQALVEHPDQLERLRGDRSLMTPAVEEILRWASPVLYQRRTIVRDTAVAGRSLEAGLPVALLWPAANRDAAAFVEPDRFDIGRSPNEHVAFGGGGPHFCLGASLARKEIAVMLGAVLDRLDRIELSGPSEWTVPGIATPVAVGIERLPIRFEPRA